jgi:hypothetical protein
MFYASPNGSPSKGFATQYSNHIPAMNRDVVVEALADTH